MPYFQQPQYIDPVQDGGDEIFAPRPAMSVLRRPANRTMQPAGGAFSMPDIDALGGGSYGAPARSQGGPAGGKVGIERPVPASGMSQAQPVSGGSYGAAPQPYGQPASPMETATMGGGKTGTNEAGRGYGQSSYGAAAPGGAGGFAQPMRQERPAAPRYGWSSQQRYGERAPSGKGQSYGAPAPQSRLDGPTRDGGQNSIAYGARSNRRGGGSGGLGSGSRF